MRYIYYFSLFSSHTLVNIFLAFSLWRSFRGRNRLNKHDLKLLELYGSHTIRSFPLHTKCIFSLFFSRNHTSTKFIIAEKLVGSFNPSISDDLTLDLYWWE